MIELLKEMFLMLFKRKKLFLIPVFIAVFILGGVLFLVQGTAFSPLIYTVF